jgi:hypothetical protein
VRGASCTPTKSRYAEIAARWRPPATGDTAERPQYFEKPPLQYWLTAAAYRVFGVHEWTARLWPALAGFLGALALGAAGYALGGLTLGAYAALVLATTLWHAGIAQIVTLDSGLSFFLGVGFSALVIAQRAETDANARRTWMWVASAALRRNAVERLIGIVLPGRRARRLYGAHPRFCGLAPAPRGLGPRDLPCADRALVRRCRAGERRIRPVLLHPRAFRALSHHGS